jgi:hypothetical protein
MQQNRKTGATMSLIKKIDVPKHFAARRAMSQVSSRLRAQVGSVPRSGIDPALAGAVGTKITQDFCLERSSSSLPLARKE